MLKRSLKVLLSFVVAFCTLSITSVKAEETSYTIYPTPHDVSYNGKSFTLSDEMNVVYSDGIDKYTESHVNDVLKILNKSGTEGQNVISNKTNVLVGIYGKDDAVNKYFNDNTNVNKDLFNKYDSYMLSIRDGVIAVLGKDTDAAFYGVTTLKHIFNQVKNNDIKELTIYDYADVKGRGFIEGYYGNPWSNEDRADLMTFGGDYKLNQYIYAPKDDPKHNSNWKALYTEKELVEIAKLAEAGNKSKCYYVYALHTFMHNAVRFDNEENYQKDLQVIKIKFEQLMGAGVKQFAILADDAGVPAGGGASYTKLMKDLTDWLIEKQKTVEGLKSDTLFCPNDYMGWGTSDQMQALKDLPDSVSIIQTGGKVWGEVGPNFNDAFYNNMGRPAYMWINWPCSDNTKDSLIMGGAEAVLKPNVDAHKIDGIVLNPMQQSEASKQGLFTNADYAWNIWKDTDHYKTVWDDSFAFMDHGTIDETVASNALREMSKHMMNSKQIGNNESFDLSPKLTQFLKDLDAGVDISAQAEDLKLEFQKLYDAAKNYKANPGNERTRNQIVYWLDCWMDTSTAVINYLDTALALQNNADNDVIWNYYAAGQTAFEQSKTHGFHYVDHTEYAVAGRLHVNPFMKSLDNNLSAKMETIINPGKQIIKYISNRSDTPEGSTDSIFDNKGTTEIVYKNPSSIAEGTYVGISYTKGIDVDKLIFRLGRNGNLKDTFSKAKVQYTNDGKEWKDLDSKIYDLPNEVVLENLGLTGVKGVRMIATEAKSNTWLGVRDIVVNPVDEPVIEEDKGTISIDKVSVQGGQLGNVTDGNTGTFTHFAEGPYKPAGAPITDYIPVDATLTLTYKNLKKLGTINFVQDAGTDKLTKYMIEYSEDGESWKSLGEYSDDATVSLNVSDQNIMAKAIRIRNLELHLVSEKVGYWWKVYDFSMVDADAIKETLTYSENWSIYKGDIANLYDGDDTTDIEFVSGKDDNTHVGDFLQWDLGEVTKIGKVHAAIGGKRDAGNKWTQYKLEYSSDGENWSTFDTYKGVDSGKDIINVNFYGMEARYVRLTNLKQRHVWVIFSEFTVKEFDPNTDFDNDNVYSNTDFKLMTEYKEDSTKLSYGGNITLAKNEFIGIDLSRIKDLKEINIDTSASDQLTIQVSKNKVDWSTLTTRTLPDARYVRLINLNDSEVTFKLNSFKVDSNEVVAPYLHETTMGINQSWGVGEDSRNNGAAFDGNVDTTTEFGDLPQKGQYIIYDLGQERSIKKLEMFCQDSAVNYIRDADILVSNDLQNWTKVVTIGDGIENTDDAGVKCIDSDAGYIASSPYPNKVSVSGEIEATQARYIKILMTATNNNRAVVFNEIVINDGEYVPVSNDPTFDSSAIEVQGFAPQNMFDGDLTTAYKANTKDAGYIQYTLSDNLDIDRINIIQKGNISNAKVMAYVDTDSGRNWVQVGALDRSLNEIYLPFWKNIYELKIEWEANKVPTISEIIMLSGNEFVVDRSKLKEYIDGLDIKESQYTVDTYKNYEETLRNANSVMADNNSSQNDINKTLESLKVAVASLDKRGNKSEISKELDEIANLVEADYTADSWNALQEQIVLANTLLQKADNALSEKEVIVMIENLNVAKSNLKTIVSVNKEILAKYIADNELDKLDTSLYLTKTAEPFSEALKAAQAILLDDTATVEAIKDAHAILQQARADLILKASDTELKGLKALADVYDENNYTKASWAEFKAVLDKVYKTIDENESTSKDISQLIDEVKAAARQLVERSNTAGLNALINLAKSLDKDKYTEESYNAVLKEVSSIEKLLVNASEMSQKEIDDLQEQLQTLLNELQGKENKPDGDQGGNQDKPDDDQQKPDENRPTPPIINDGDQTTPPIINGGDENQNNDNNNQTNNNQVNNGQNNVAQTGDNTNIAMLLGFAMLSVCGLYVYRKKEDVK